MKRIRSITISTRPKVRQCPVSQAPTVTGQCVQVLNILRRCQDGVLSFELTADAAIPEAAARIHDLRHKGFNIITRIEPEIQFRGVTRRNVARYFLGEPAWPAPGFFSDVEGWQ
ncbi:helix-turn-helix domain-containing protein [Laribacter hongkongensis]|uniref:Helix-turn-helix domain-containing protein n=1 Tax=Laribacter hongkongensis TaxID=168471 RepID=A0ABD4SUN1_9NEIS|nr:helix-turn-helix domain-containing protein [Laribacter hongkongensis]MCG9026937.1 helix-turn-helix domain-containing protein [Laribacter hongkongensis]MCG9100293.1 helix-turn-helix domain-containing protein [Laribacter hongkongensis]MCG9119653.1 helix-turn-helix domain-containing protein [Laribacter hongkongensis]